MDGGSNTLIRRIGTDLYPNKSLQAGKMNANSTVSWRGAIGHEIVGHREAAQKGWTQTDIVYEEVQASIRAAKFTPRLRNAERELLFSDAIARLPDGVVLDKILEQLNVSER